MSGVSLKCGDCGALLRSVEEAQEHAELTSHSNFSESTEPVLNLVCTTCSKPCRSKTESDLHTKRTGHTEFVDKTSEAAKPISLEAPKVDATSQDTSGATTDQNEEMVVPEVDKKLLEELESMGFSTARATRALHYSGNTGLEAAVSWIVEHENDPDIDQMPLVPTNTKVEAPKPSLTPGEIKAKQQELRIFGVVHERIRIGKELLEAKRIEEENERKRLLALRKAEKEEEKRAREKIRQKLEEDKAERRRRLGLPPEEPSEAKPSTVVEEKKSFLPVRPATKAEQMRECLRSLKQNHKEDDARVKRAFQTLLTYVGNVARNPSEEKFRKIRLSNQTFQERVGALKGGIEFLEICGFEKIEGGEFLFLPRDKVEMAVLNSAGSELDSAIKNPFFGVL
ncbi:Zinc finger C2H2-type [Sesbania bispinosa]|nr:Zinc finger C2H2-type [Sesbania bispinosa]